MRHGHLIYKRKISFLGVLLFFTISTIEILYKIAKFTIKSLYRISVWFIRYIRFIRAGYSYSDVYNLIMSMSGREFEIFIAELFKASGKYKKVELTPQSNDGGKDIVLLGNDGTKTYVETKRWSENLDCGRVLLQKLSGAAYADRIDNMIFITTCGYNKNAYEYAEKLSNLELWDMTDIMKMVTKIEQDKVARILYKSLGNNSKIIKLQPC